MNRVSENIKRARIEGSLSQKQLAKKLGVSESFINEVESGRRVLSEDTINRLSKVLNINLNDVNMYDEEVMEEVKPKKNVIASVKEKKNAVNDIWSEAFGSVIKNIPILDYDLSTVISTKVMPLLSNKINGFSMDKVAFLKIHDDDMIGYRIAKDDIAFVNLTHEFENNSICLIEHNSERVVRLIKKLDSSKVLLISNRGTLRTETVNLKDIKILAKLIYTEVILTGQQ